MGRYYDLTESQKLELDTNTLRDAILLEAVHRGIKPPISLPEAINQGAYPTYTLPAERTVFWELIKPGSYGSYEETGVCYRTQQEAESALRGVIAVKFERYSNLRNYEIYGGEWTIRAIYVGSITKSARVGVITDYAQDDTEFDKLVAEIEADLWGIRQSRYDAEIRRIKRSEYMRLANGDEAIASAFWAKTEKTEWPISA